MKSNHIELFQKRMETELPFCKGLFEYATVRLLAFKYAYYVLDKHIVEDITYDGEEKNWYNMGIALGVLKEDETSPCVGFDASHPLARKAMKLAARLPEKKLK